MIWNIKEFESLVQGCYGEELLKKLESPLSSVLWKFMLADYHADESRRLYRSYISEESEEGSIKELVYVIGQVLKAESGSEEANKFKEARMLSEAHIIAYAQSLHSTADILAQVIYIGINLESNLTKPIPEDNISLKNINDCMRKKEFALNVVKSIDALIKSPEFQYLQAYVNKTKHQSLVDLTHYVSLNTPKYGILMLPFEYKGHSFPEKWADDFVIQDFQTIKKSVFCIGHELNKFLEKMS